MSEHDPNDLAEIADLRAELARLVEDAAKLASETHDETARIQAAHDDEMAGLLAARAEERVNFEAALSSRDLIGQAKGLLMARGRISAQSAFQLLVTQSQQRNVKLVAICQALVDQHHSRVPSDSLADIEASAPERS